LRPHPLDHIPILEAAEGLELSSSEVEARSIDPLCYAASLLLLVRDVGIEPTSSRLKGECISLSANPAILVGDAGIEPAWSRLRVECICHLCQSPMSRSKWCRMWESNQRLAVIDRGLDLRANPARSTTSLRSVAQGKLWCAVRELNPRLLGVGQLFWSVELPARKIGRGYRSRTCLAALIWRRSGYKPLPLAGGPSTGGSRWIRTIRDGFMRAAFFLLN
jgi:hypothetical protein